MSSSEPKKGDGSHPASTCEDSGHAPRDSDQICELFKTSQVRSHIYRAESNVPKLPVTAVELIGTTSALFLRSLVEQAANAEGESEYVTLDQLRTVAARDPSLEAFQTTLENITGQDSLRAPTEFKPAKKAKRKRSPTGVHTAKRIAGAVGASAEEIHQRETVDLVKAGATSTFDQIVADESDYD